MKAIKKPIKINCWLITQKELDDIWERKMIKEGNGLSAFGGKLYGAEVWFFKERKDDYNKKKGWGNVVVKIKTLKGDMLLSAGNYLIKSVAKNFYPCRADIFKKTYKIIK